MRTMQAEYATGLERIAGENRAALERNNAAFERLRPRRTGRSRAWSARS